MHDMYVKFNVNNCKKEMFRKSHFPQVSMLPQEANIAFVRGEVELVAVEKLKAVSPPKVLYLIHQEYCV